MDGYGVEQGEGEGVGGKVPAIQLDGAVAAGALTWFFCMHGFALAARLNCERSVRRRPKAIPCWRLGSNRRGLVSLARARLQWKWGKGKARKGKQLVCVLYQINR